MFKLGSTALTATDTQREEAKKGWQIVQKINMALHGQHFLQTGFASPTRVRMQRIKRRDGIFQRDMLYTISFKDMTAAKKKIMTQATKISIDTNSI